MDFKRVLSTSEEAIFRSQKPEPLDQESLSNHSLDEPQEEPSVGIPISEGLEEDVGSRTPSLKISNLRPQGLRAQEPIHSSFQGVLSPLVRRSHTLPASSIWEHLGMHRCVLRDCSKHCLTDIPQGEPNSSKFPFSSRRDTFSQMQEVLDCQALAESCSRRNARDLWKVCVLLHTSSLRAPKRS